MHVELREIEEFLLLLLCSPDEQIEVKLVSVKKAPLELGDPKGKVYTLTIGLIYEEIIMHGSGGVGKSVAFGYFINSEDFSILTGLRALESTFRQ